MVISGQPEFFAITKRLHNRLHGFPGDGGPLGGSERGVYEQTLADSAGELVRLVRSRDIVILHDPQTAGLTSAVRQTGATVIWRCHVGLDHANEHAHTAWNFLRPYVLEADSFVFSRGGFAWEGLLATMCVHTPDHFEVAPEVMGAEELLSHAPLCLEAHRRWSFRVGDETGEREADLLEIPVGRWQGAPRHLSDPRAADRSLVANPQIRTDLRDEPLV